MNHEAFMHRCLQLALLGSTSASPNPMVGAVLVHDGEIIGEGYHMRYGEAHAEVNCINSVAEANRSRIPQSTLYVSLEPCAHYGKTPPCALLIIEQQIRHVVVACQDPFVAVNGKGIDLLREAGITVTLGVLQQEARKLNKRFFTFYEKSRPYIFLKWAQTADGFIAGEARTPVAISSAITNRFTHQLRGREAAIMVGKNTVLADDPSLTNRFGTGKNPARIFVDRNLSVPATATIYNNAAHTIVFNSIKNGLEDQAEFILLKDESSLVDQVMQCCIQRKYLSLIVEGGTQLLQQFIDAQLWDEALIITNKTLYLDAGIKAPALINSRLGTEWNWRTDQLQIFTNTFSSPE